MTTWVVDTSPLIFLTKLGRLELLRAEARTICVPQAVIDEIRAKPDEAAQLVEDAVLDWLVIRHVSNRQAVEILLADLGSGEAETIILAKELGADKVVMDDLDARRFARRVGLELIGTLGLLLAAHLEGKIPPLRAEIDRLQSLGFHVSATLVEAILQKAES